MLCRYTYTLCILFILAAEQNLSEDGINEIIFGGDVSFAGIIYYLKRIENCSYKESFEKIESIFKQADDVVINLESPLGDVQNPPRRNDEAKDLHLLAETESVQSLKSIHVTAATLANNHILDFDENTVNFTAQQLLQQGIAYSGVIFGNNSNDPQVPVMLDKHNVKVALLSYCVEQDGCNDSREVSNISPAIYSPEAFKRDIKYLKSKQEPDIIVLYMHWDMDCGNFKEDGKNNRVVLFLQQFVDVIIGTHPHLKNGHYYVNNTLVVQSLGNLLFPLRGTPFKIFDADGVNQMSYEEQSKKVYAMVKKDKNSSAFSKIVKIRFKKDGIDKANSMYMDLVTDISKKKCLYIRPTKSNTTWNVICASDDDQCLNHD